MPDEPKEVLRLENVTVQFDETVALDRVNFSLAEGETKIILGAAGSGKTVLLNATTSPWAFGEDADAVWRNLRRVELRPFQQNKVEADRDDPLRATLRGKVVIQASYGGQAEVSQLKLVREKDNAWWKIDPAEIERTFKSRSKPK